ncbi:MAG: clostripain-related cysteine peptidase [Bacteroidales bacterium]|nr:clostripain-related cysteine peptidase [Bacteroidales bacterium]
MRIKNIIFCLKAALTVLVGTAVLSCDPKEDADFIGPEHNSTGIPGDRVGDEESRHVLLIYQAGFNTLSSYMEDDYEDLLKGYLPVDHHSRADNVLLVYRQTCSTYGNYTEELSSHLIKLNSTPDGRVVADTLMTYGGDVISADSQTLRTVLEDVKTLFPAKDYGMVFSSHATGWLPAGATVNYRTISKGPERSAGASPERSVGQTQTGYSGSYLCYEMDLKNFAKAFPMKFDYILFDACLMGCVEVAYEIKDICDIVGFSPTEVLADGFVYSTLTQRLLKGSNPDPIGVISDFYAQYEGSSSPYCTASVVDCSKMDRLAEVCSRLFEKYRSQIRNVSPSRVQGYFRFNWHWFYDLKDILVQSGISPEDLEELQEVLDDCVIYDEATPQFLGFPIRTHCGMSMYLPSNGSAQMSVYYRELAWNKATNLL